MSANPLSSGRFAFSDAAAPEREGAEQPAWSDWQQQSLRRLQQRLAEPTAMDRRAILDALSGAIRDATATGNAAAAIFCDLNGFSGINAAWGPSIGDDVLTAIAARLADFVHEHPLGRTRESACIGRLDADHFLIVVKDVESFGSLRSRTVELISAMAQPVSLSGRSISLAARAAIVQIPSHGRSATSVLGRGFRLLNSTARSASEGVAVSDTDAGYEPFLIMLEHDLTSALKTDQLFIALQPKVEAATGLVQGAEALARWQHPERGALAPPVFIEAAERSGLIFDLGLRILRDVCRASNSFASKDKGFSLAVNVSPHQLGHPDFLGRFLEVVDREGVDPEALEIEVTETAAMMGGDSMLDALRALRRCGIGVAIDDFGTGFSNLASLSVLPADELKIDQSLVSGGNEGGTAEVLLNIAVQLGQTFGLKTVAEGVETQQQMQHLKALGCDLVQGYFTGRPVRSSEFAERYLKD